MEKENDQYLEYKSFDNYTKGLSSFFIKIKIHMDFDGILLLVERDRERFKKWLESSKNLSLEELEAGYNEWLEHYNESYKKYIDLETVETMKDAPLLGAKLIYLHDLLNCAFHALTAYTVKLKEEYDILKKQEKSNTKKNYEKGKKANVQVKKPHSKTKKV